MTQSTKPVSALRQRMIDDMTLRKLNAKTQSAYVRAVVKFTRFFGRSPDLASAEDLRRFQLQMVEHGVSSTTLNATITGLKFFFDVTLDRPELMRKMSHVYQPRKIPVVLSIDEVTRLLQSAGCLKYKAALGVAYGATASPESMLHLRDRLPKDAIWSAFGISRHQFPMVAQAVLLGGLVRVGLEDNIYLGPGELAPSNASLVERAAVIVEALGATVATPAEARAILGLGAGD